ncbi:MAG: S8 family serine peptidase, partial [Cyanobacteria bacterium P01_D01_bin.73]
MVTANWEQIQKQRKAEDKPDLPEAVPFILQVDPKSFDADDLRTFGIEVISELENGYIIGAAADVEFSDLQKKISQCIDKERGGGKIPEIWEILEGTKRPEYILSEQLLGEWDNIKDQQIYIVDVGIACVGVDCNYSDYPKQGEGEDGDKYIKRVVRWQGKRKITEQKWGDLQWEREQEFTRFIDSSKGNIIESASWDDPSSLSLTQLADSFSCRVQLSGKALKDMVLNFPYIFDVSEPDQYYESLQKVEGSESSSSTFELISPDSNASTVCVIDSGIQERHPLLQKAIKHSDSHSWVPYQTFQTSDQVQTGHGTRVAGAVIYPQTIPTSGQYQPVCWLQNARILDEDCKLSDQLFPPKVLEQIVEHFHKTKGTRIFNHSITGSVPCRTQ